MITGELKVELTAYGRFSGPAVLQIHWHIPSDMCLWHAVRYKMRCRKLHKKLGEY